MIECPIVRVVMVVPSGRLVLLESEYKQSAAKLGVSLELVERNTDCAYWQEVVPKKGNDTSELRTIFLTWCNSEPVRSFMGVLFPNARQDQKIGHGPDWVPGVNGLLDVASLDPAEYEKLCPYRTKQDKNIRRMRIEDLQHVQDNRVNIGSGGLDYIAQMGWSLSNLLMTTGSCSFLGLVQAMDSSMMNGKDLEYRIDALKKVSNQVKLAPLNVTDDLAAIATENYSFGGFRNLPYPGFDKHAAFEDLADPERTFTATHNEFRDALSRVCGEDNATGEYVTLTDYARSLDWVTAGGSDVKQVIFWRNGLKHEVKPKKNLVPLALSTEELVNLALETTSEVNRGFEKTEVGKVRVAVAGDMGTYMGMSWILKMYGSGYDHWRGSTLGEKGVAIAMRRLLWWNATSRRLWAMPYDFDGFDHQPSLDEVWLCWDHICNRVAPLCKGDDQFEIIRRNTLAGIKDCKLTWYEQIHEGKAQVQVTRQVKGGLNSGLRVTTIVGNMWNAASFDCVIAKTKANLGFLDLYSVRGDDTAVWDERPERLQRLFAGTQELGLRAGKGKFGITLSSCEFLRERVTPSGWSGYAGRALVAVMQRKPWDPAPYSPYTTVSAYSSALCQVARRLRRTPGRIEGLLMERQCSKWASKHDAPVQLIWSPPSVGGGGVNKWWGDDYEWGEYKARLEDARYNFEATAIDRGAVGEGERLAGKWGASAEEFVNSGMAKASFKRRMSGAAGSDGYIMKEDVLPKLNVSRLQVKKTPELECSPSLAMRINKLDGGKAYGLQQMEVYQAPYWGTDPSAAEDWREIKEAQQLGVSTSRMEKRKIVIRKQLVAIESRLNCRRHFSFDWLGAVLPLNTDVVAGEHKSLFGNIVALSIWEAAVGWKCGLTSQVLSSAVKLTREASALWGKCGLYTWLAI